jgi:ABC-type sugar transport system ATPase subunit
MASLTQVGHVVILVSHRLSDLVAHCPRVAIIRDGRCPVVLGGDALSEEAVAAELVVGHASRGEARAASAATSVERDLYLELEGWTHRYRAFSDVDLGVFQGEIMALVGVEGSGARELLQSLAGFQPAKGRVRIADRSGEEALRLYTAYVAPDRHESLFANLSVGENIVSRLGRPQIARLWGALRRRRAMALAREFIRQFAIRCRSVAQPIGSLSGGNQQKAAIASAIIAKPRLLILEEPTRGVDIGSKGEIYEIMRRYTREGRATLIYCTEVPEVFEVADRVHIMSDGRLSEPLVVANYPDVEALAKDIAAREQHVVLPRTA